MKLQSKSYACIMVAASALLAIAVCLSLVVPDVPIRTYTVLPDLPDVRGGACWVNDTANCPACPQLGACNSCTEVIPNVLANCNHGGNTTSCTSLGPYAKVRLIQATDIVGRTGYDTDTYHCHSVKYCQPQCTIGVFGFWQCNEDLLASDASPQNKTTLSDLSPPDVTLCTFGG